MKKEKGILLVVGALALLAAFWLLGGRAVAAEAVYPVERAHSWFARHVVPRARALWRRDRLSAENARLKRQVEVLRMALAETGVKADTEDDAVRAMEAKGWIRAEVLSRNGAMGVEHLMRVDRGSLAGVRRNAPVVAPDGLVGKIVETSPHTAVVKLVTDPSMKVSCEIETGMPEIGAVYGIMSGGGVKALVGDAACGIVYLVNPFRLRHVRSDVGAAQGVPPRARVVTSGLGGTYPKGIQVGYLMDGTREDGERLEREGEVLPAVDLPALETVFIRREK